VTVVFPAGIDEGHRLRVALSTSYWPVVWPAPEPVTLRVATGPSRLELPVRAPRAADASLAPFDAPEGAAPALSEDLHPGGFRKSVERDPATGEVVVTTWLDAELDGTPSLTRLPAIDLEVGHAIVERLCIHDDDPLSARAEVEHRTQRRRGAWSVRTVTRARLHATLAAFHLEAELEAHEGDERVFARRWQATIPRSGG
jgi:hypothetical protein